MKVDLARYSLHYYCHFVSEITKWRKFKEVNSNLFLIFFLTYLKLNLGIDALALEKGYHIIECMMVHASCTVRWDGIDRWCGVSRGSSGWIPPTMRPRCPLSMAWFVYANEGIWMGETIHLMRDFSREMDVDMNEYGWRNYSPNSWCFSWIWMESNGRNDDNAMHDTTDVLPAS